MPKLAGMVLSKMSICNVKCKLCFLNNTEPVLPSYFCPKKISYKIRVILKVGMVITYKSLIIPNIFFLAKIVYC